MKFEELRYVVGHIIRDQRVSTGWTQQQLAAAVDMKRTTISNIEAGRQSMNLEQFCSIMEVIGVEPGSLLNTAIHRATQGGRREIVEDVVNSSHIQDESVRKRILDALK